MAGSQHLACPLCGEENRVSDDLAFSCAHCGGTVRRAPHGKAFVLLAVEMEAPGSGEAEAMLRQALSTDDPVKRKALLLRGAAISPRYLPIQEELLHLGDLDQRDSRPLDFRLIKCYLLHPFDSPEEVGDDAPAMMEELASHPQLRRCLSLTGDRDAFLRRYLTRLSRDYIRIFLVGSNKYIPRIFGFATKSPDAALGRPGAQIIRRMMDAPLPEPFRTLLPSCFEEAYRQEIGSDAALQRAKGEMEI